MHGSGPRAFSNWTFTSDSGQLMKGGILIEASKNPVVRDGHCEWYSDDCVRINKGTGQTVGGEVRDIYPANASGTTSVVRLGTNGPGQPMSTLAEDIDIGPPSTVSPPYTAPPAIIDDQHGITLPPGDWPHVSYYAPGGMASADNQAFTLLGHINNNITGSSGNRDNAGTCTLSVSVPPTCTVNFALAWTTAPVCTASDQTSAAALKAAATTTSLTITGGTGAAASDKVAYQCQGNPN